MTDRNKGVLFFFFITYSPNNRFMDGDLCPLNQYGKPNSIGLNHEFNLL